MENRYFWERMVVAVPVHHPRVFDGLVDPNIGGHQKNLLAEIGLEDS